jgi:uncharacterized damage-inducible protein DinB
MGTDTLLDLFAHMEWADARVWEATMAHGSARGDAALRALILHTHTVQNAFLDAWTQQPFAFRDRYDHTSLEAELETVRAYYPRARAFLESLTDAQRAAPIVLPWTAWVEQHLGRAPGPTTLGETILQVLTHSTHHRAQANTRLRTLGAEPPMIDYIAWLWLERPAAVWPALTVV